MDYLSMVMDVMNSNKGYIIRANGEITSFDPTVQHNKKNVFDMDSVRKACNFDYFELVRMKKTMFICDEEGLLKSKTYNHVASTLFNILTNGYSMHIVGDVVFCNEKAVN